jgi:dienelactone hydrolase
MDGASINKLLEHRVRELASRKAPKNAEEHAERVRTEREAVAKALGLHPLPPRTDLQARTTGSLQYLGYRIEKVAFSARPSFASTAHLYMPDGPGPHPVVLVAHGHWSYKKSEPVFQALGIGLALQGIAAMIVDSPGYSWDDNPQNERRNVGAHDDPILAMGAPVTGVYVWDLIRALDYLGTRTDIDRTRIGMTGASGGGTATMYTHALDDRILCAAPVVSMASMETAFANGCLCNHVPGILLLGDRADILGLRAPAPILIVAATDDPEFPVDATQRTNEKLRAIYRSVRAEDNVRYEEIEGPHDLSRRMREALLAFFAEHLQGEPRRGHLVEKRPLTDSTANPYPANTLDPTAPELTVLYPEERTRTTFRDLVAKALIEPYPSQDLQVRLVRWGRHGRVPSVKPTATLKLVDGGETAKDGGIVGIAAHEIDQRLCVYLGLSIPEVYAQLLHLLLPGGPEGWESVAASDALTTMIASVKTLVGKAEAAETPVEVVAEGPVASMAALWLKAFRPEIAVSCSHPVASWSDVFASGLAELTQPGARYIAFPGSSV